MAQAGTQRLRRLFDPARLRRLSDPARQWLAAGSGRGRRAVVVLFAGIFAVSLVGSLIASLSGGGAVAAPAQRQREVAHSTAGRGERALLTLSDLPAGWKSAGIAAPATATSPWSKQLASCVGVPARVAKIAPAKINGPGFTSADHVFAVEDSVSVYRSAAQARAGYAAMADAKTPACMNTVGGAALRSGIQREAGSNATVGTVTIAALEAATRPADSTGFTVTIPLVSGSRLLTITSTQVAILEGSLVQELTFNGNGTAFPSQLEQQLVAAARHRH